MTVSATKKLGFLREHLIQAHTEELWFIKQVNTTSSIKLEFKHETSNLIIIIIKKNRLESSISIKMQHKFSGRNENSKETNQNALD